MLTQQICIFVIVWVIRCWRTVDEINVTRVCKLQNALDIVGVQSPNLIHHAMYDEITTLFGSFLFEYIDEHNIDHCFHQYVRAIGTHIVDTLHPVGVVVVLLDTELQAESIAK